jgi:sortase A
MPSNEDRNDQPTRGSIQRQARRHRVLENAGKVLIAAGLLVLAFVAFEIFGTSYLQQRHQSALRSQIDPTHVASHIPADVASSEAPPVTVPTIAPPATGSPVAIILIPKIGLNQVVVEGTGTSQLELGPGHYAGTPLPGEQGNVAIAGHRTTWGRPFYDLNELADGDQILLSTSRGTFVYRVSSSQVVSPSDVSVLDPTSAPTLTLTTCSPRFSAAQRLVVTATLASTITSLALHLVGTGHASATVAHSTASGGGDTLGILGWGALCALLAAGAWISSKRIRKRWIAWVVVAPFFLVALFFFFDAISNSLPAGY